MDEEISIGNVNSPDHLLDSDSGSTANDMESLFVEKPESLDDLSFDIDNDDKYNGVYFFESDHVALKHNEDYNKMLKTIAVLEAQRIQALNDLDVLHEKLQNAVHDPINFVEKLQNRVDLKLPNRQQVEAIPTLDWSKYTKNSSFLALGKSKHMTRWKTQIEDDIISVPTASTSDESNNCAMLVRGRVKQEGKCDTFNKLWSVEEQQHLEQLLVEYPEEAVESRRYRKIAKALGTRTHQQVASRIQKYFIKLARAGLSVPGRLPAIYNYTKKAQHHHQKYQIFYQQPSTFLASHKPPVYMSDEEDNSPCWSSSESVIMQSNSDLSQSISNITQYTSDISDEDDISPDLRDTPEYKELLRLKKLKRHKTHIAQLKHQGFKCCICGSDPIIGVRWHCRDCSWDSGTDLCQNCSSVDYESDTHNTSHRLEKIESFESVKTIDEDYTHFQPEGYNYLDPNFMPAT